MIRTRAWVAMMASAYVRQMGLRRVAFIHLRDSLGDVAEDIGLRREIVMQAYPPDHVFRA